MNDGDIKITFTPEGAARMLSYLRAVQRPGIFAVNMRFGWDEVSTADSITRALAWGLGEPDSG